MKNWTEVCEPYFDEQLGCMVHITIKWGRKEFDPNKAAMSFMAEMFGLTEREPAFR